MPGRARTRVLSATAGQQFTVPRAVQALPLRPGRDHRSLTIFHATPRNAFGPQQVDLVAAIQSDVRMRLSAAYLRLHREELCSNEVPWAGL